MNIIYLHECNTRVYNIIYNVYVIYIYILLSYLCGIPILKLSTPTALEQSMTVFIAGINTSHPSRPNLFSLVHLLARNSSNLNIATCTIMNGQTLINFNDTKPHPHQQATPTLIKAVY